MKIVLVEWEDPCSYAVHGWLPKEGSDTTEMLPLKCVTIGVLYQENDERIVVVLNMNADNFCQAQCIPKGSIKRIRQLTIK